MEKSRTKIVVLAERKDVTFDAFGKVTFHGSKVFVFFPFSKSRYSSSGRKAIQRKFRKRIKNFSGSGVFLTLTFDPKRYTLLSAWRGLSKRIKRTMNTVKTAKTRDTKKHSKKRKIEYIWVIEAQKTQKNGYPYVHVFYPELRYLLPNSTTLYNLELLKTNAAEATPFFKTPYFKGLEEVKLTTQ